jgi:6-pyruvoyltetrahydropterin/6-carboxytetrahydropterin synthase
MMLRLARAKSFSAAYRSYDSTLSEAENQRVYGVRARAPGYGCNFVLEAHVEGSVDPLTGMIVNLMDLDRWLGEVAGELDHQMLHELESFSGQVVTLERVAAFALARLTELMKRDGAQARVFKVRMHEGPALWVDCFGKCGH